LNRILRGFGSLLRNLFRRDRADAELDEELQAYVQMLADEKRAQGLSPGEALRAARLEVGGTEPVKEQVRDARAGAWIESIGRDLRYAVRSLRRSPGFTAAATLTLALAIGANTALFSVVHGMLIRPLPYAQAEELFRVWEFWPNEPPFRHVVSPDYGQWRDMGASFEAVGGYGKGGRGGVFHLTGDGEAERLDGAAMTSNFLDLLGVQAAAGRTFLEDECLPGASPVVMLSHGLWMRRFGGSTDALSQSITLNGQDHVVVGVLPQDFVFPDNEIVPDLVVPLTLPTTPNWTSREEFRVMRAIARVRAETSPETVEQELTVLARSTAEIEPVQFQNMRKDLEVRLTPLRERLVGDVRSLLWILQGAVGVVLLIGCLNIANLQVARGLARRKEIAVRAAIGAGRARLARQLLTESVLLGLAGGVGGLAAGYAVLPWLREFLPGDLQLLKTVRVDGVTLAFTALVATIAGLIAGLAPLRVAFGESLHAGGGRTTVGERSGRLRAVLVLAQVSLAMVLLSASGLLIRAFADRAAVDPGFEPRGVLSLRVSLRGDHYSKPAVRQEFARRLLEQAGALPSVESVAIAGGAPVIGVPGAVSTLIEGRPEPAAGTAPAVPLLPTSPSYFETLGIAVLRGRGFSAKDGADGPPTALVDETFAAEFFPFGDPLGKRIRTGARTGPWREVVGIVRNVGVPPGQTVRPQIYVPLEQSSISDLVVLIKSDGPPTSLLRPVRDLVREMDPTLPVHDAAAMEQRVRAVLSGPRSNSVLMSLLGSLSLLLAVVGLVGLLSYGVTQRSREIGIRMALGARRRAVLARVLRQGMVLTACGVALGLIASPLTVRALEAQLVGTRAASPSTFIWAALLFLAAAAAACLLPASRAARIQPTEALRHE